MLFYKMSYTALTNGSNTTTGSLKWAVKNFLDGTWTPAYQTTYGPTMNDWNTSSVTDMSSLFYNKYSFKLFAIFKELNIWDFHDANYQIAKRSEAEINCPITFTYTPNEAKKLLGNGFHIDSIEKDHIFKYNIYTFMSIMLIILKFH